MWLYLTRFFSLNLVKCDAVTAHHGFVLADDPEHEQANTNIGNQQDKAVLKHNDSNTRFLKIKLLTSSIYKTYGSHTKTNTNNFYHVLTTF